MACSEFHHSPAISLRGLIAVVLAGLGMHAGFPDTTIAQSDAERTAAVQQKRDDDSQLLAGLRKRRLFESAEFYCQEQLKDSAIDPTSQASLVIEWMKTRTAKAILTPPDERETNWQRVQQVSSEFVTKHPDHPRKFLVEVQQALSHIAHGQLIRQEIDADMATPTARSDALEEIKQARSLLSDLQREIAKAVPEQRGKNLSEHDLTPEQLMNLNNNVQYQLAVCNLNRAQLYETADRLNRIDALNGVRQRLDEVQRTSSEGQPLWWKTKLGQIECARLLGTPNGARKLAESLPKKDASISTRFLLMEQMARIAIELGDEAFSRDIFTEFESLDAPTPQLSLAILELTVDLANRASTEDRKQEWLAYAGKFSNSIDNDFGGYWGRRADLILIEATGVANIGSPNGSPIKMTDSANISPVKPAGPNNVELDLLTRLADEAFRKERFDDALKAYDRASKLALSIGANAEALQADLRAGLILEKQKKHDLAAEKLIEAANRDPSFKLASSTHLRGCWNFAQTIGKDQNRRALYKQQLTDHLSQWPDSPSTNQARVYLGKYLQASQEWESALQTYLQVAVTSPLLGSALEQAATCAHNALSATRRSAQPTQTMTARINNAFHDVQSKLPANDPLAMRSELIRAELNLLFGSSVPDASLAKKFSTIALSGDQSLANLARAIHAASICIEQPDLARQLLGSFADDENAIVRCERCLAAIQQHSNLPDSIQRVLELRLDAIEQALALPSINEPDSARRKTAWLLKKSEVLTGLNRQPESIGVLTELERTFPRNAGVQMQLARAMTIQFGQTEPEKPLNKWRRVAARLKPHTPNWFEAKYEVSRLVFESGDPARATKLLKHIQAIPPGWEGSQFQTRFESLLQQCESAGR